MLSYIDKKTGKEIFLEDEINLNGKIFKRSEIEADASGKLYYDYIMACGYNPFAIGYYQIDWSELLYLTFDLKDKTVLEVGSGANTYMTAMRNIHPDVDYYALEPSAFMQNKIGQFVNYIGSDSRYKTLLTGINEYLKPRVKQEMIHDCSFHDNQFDFIWSTMVFEHIHPKQLDKSLERLHKLLKPDGIIFILTTHADYWHPTHKIIENGDWWYSKAEKYGFIDESEKYIDDLRTISKSKLKHGHDFCEMHKNDNWLLMVWRADKSEKEKEITNILDKNKKRGNNARNNR